MRLARRTHVRRIEDDLDKARDLEQDRDEVAVRASPGPAAMALDKLDKPPAAVAVETIGTDRDRVRPSRPSRPGPAAVAPVDVAAMLDPLALGPRPLSSTSPPAMQAHEGRDELHLRCWPPAAVAPVHVHALVTARFVSRSTPRESRFPCACIFPGTVLHHLSRWSAFVPACYRPTSLLPSRSPSTSR